MAKYPAAEWHPLGAPGAPYTSGPFKIVHHTTEGSTIEGALSALGAAHSESHFVVGRGRNGVVEVLQLIDTALSARSLRNQSGGVETNRDSAIQIELVGFAGKPKDRESLRALRDLLRWIERTHNVPPVWPNGLPKPPRNGQDPGGHNRNAQVWNLQGGHYGHSNVPENYHWDPAYTAEEVEFLMAGATGVDPGDLEEEEDGPTRVRVFGIAPERLNLRKEPSGTGQDIGDVFEGLELTAEELSPDGQWLYVVTPAGFKGWVAKRFTVPV